MASKELKKIGNYDIQKMIGKGSFGTLYLAVNRKT